MKGVRTKTGLSPLEQQALSRFRGEITGIFGPRLLQMKVFGSRARGGSHEWSDLDLFILMDRVTPVERDKIFEIAAVIYGDLEVDISPLVMTEDEFRLWLSRERALALDIEREGIPV